MKAELQKTTMPGVSEEKKITRSAAKICDERIFTV